MTDPDGDPEARAAQLTTRLHRQLLDGPTAESRAVSPAEQRRRLRALAREHDPLLAGGRVDEVVEQVRARVDGLGPLEPLLADPAVDEVMVNGGGEVWVERHGRLVSTELVLAEATTLALAERIVAPLGLHVDRANPLVDARLPDGSRVNVVVRPLAVDGPCLTIRRFGARRVPLDEVATPGVVALLRWSVRARANLIVSGGAGAGKTTLLNALAAEIPDHERVITIEDAAELRLPGRQVVRLEARPPSAEGHGEVRVRDLVRNALRMRPDRIVVGEVRAGEALDMLQAMNTGHEGSLSTCHANAPVDALRRLETLVLMGDVALPHAAVREQLRAAVDLVVQIARRPDGGRRVVAVAEVLPADDPAGPLVARSLTDDAGHLVALPLRAVRSPGAHPPSPTWLEGQQ
nr:CpaF family protein [Rhabdothermincola salaria]